DAAIEEPPGHVSHQCFEECAYVHGVGEGPAVACRPGNVRKVFVAAETEGAQLEGMVAGDGVGLGSNDLFCYGVHDVTLFESWFVNAAGLDAAWLYRSWLCAARLNTTWLDAA